MAESSRPIGGRPLSPHLQVWRWHVTLAVSIAHRFAGIGLYAGLILLAGWAVALAGGPSSFAAYTDLLQTPVGLVILFLVTLAGFFHLANGIRHLVWDFGRGFKPKTADATAFAVIIFAIVATVVFWFRMAAFGAFAHV
jgi:succinate dehydrogenase / fumarate reductase, cytochrome b subunit